VRILLDECLPKDLKHDLADHDALTVGEMGWSGVKNGKLLTLAEEYHFEVFLTADRSIEYQQNLAKRPIAFAVFISPDNKAETLRPLMPAFLHALPGIHPGEVVHIAQERK
jgi:hypothetical protein